MGFIETKQLSEKYSVSEIKFLSSRYPGKGRFAIICQLDGESAIRVIEVPAIEAAIGISGRRWLYDWI